METHNSSAKTNQEVFLNKKKHLSSPCIAEDGYQKQMEQTVEPYLQQHLTCGKLGELYYEFYAQSSPKGTIVISFGFTESCEKYHELIYYMHREGYQAAILDHRAWQISP